MKPLVKTTKGKGLVERFTKRQQDLAAQISNDIAEDIDNGWTRGQLMTAVAYYADLSADAWVHHANREIAASLAILAAGLMDWKQVALNGGPPCFHQCSDGRFCGRAEGWLGHQLKADHQFVSLVSLIKSLTQNQKK